MTGLASTHSQELLIALLAKLIKDLLRSRQAAAIEIGQNLRARRSPMPSSHSAAVA
jgi:hypothetical protein